MIKAIDTRYNGFYFRSRLEARWAVFFDALGLEYQYEPEGFDIDGDWYLPDFFLPHFNAWIEIKPTIESFDFKLKSKMATISSHFQQPFLAIAGQPDYVMESEGGYYSQEYIQKFSMILIAGYKVLDEFSIEKHCKVTYNNHELAVCDLPFNNHLYWLTEDFTDSIVKLPDECTKFLQFQPESAKSDPLYVYNEEDLKSFMDAYHCLPGEDRFYYELYIVRFLVSAYEKYLDKSAEIQIPNFSIFRSCNYYFESHHCTPYITPHNCAGTDNQSIEEAANKAKSYRF